MLFGRKQPEGKTVLILDIESGSVGAALARVDASGIRLLGEYRRYLPVRSDRSAEALAQGVQKLAAEGILRMSELAVRLRAESAEPGVGDVSSIAAFMAPPWGKPNLHTGRPDFLPRMQEIIGYEARPYFDHTPRFFTSAGAATHGLRALAPYESDYLLCAVTHEMTELVLVQGGAVVGHATIPYGISLPLRTLKTHGDLSDAQARAALISGEPQEPLLSSALHYGGEFRNAARELFDSGVPERVWVVSAAGEHFARALSHEGLSDLFPQGGLVGALQPHHASRYVSFPQGDLFLVLEALFIGYTD